MSDFAPPPDEELRRDTSAPAPVPTAAVTGSLAAAAARDASASPVATRRRDRADAQRRVQRIRAFRAELDALTAAGVADLTDGQRVAIHAHHDAIVRQLAIEHDVDQSDAASQMSRGMQIAALVAAIALTAAVYALVSRFWGRLDLPLQATLLCAFPLVALIGVMMSAERERTLYVASIFALVAFGTYWLAVVVLSERLNLPVTPPAIWGGALFGVALALPYGFRLIFGAALVALLVALAGSVFQAAGIPWTVVPEFPEVITAAAFLMTPIASQVGTVHTMFAQVTRAVSFGIGFFGLLILSSLGMASLLPMPVQATEAIYQGVLLVAATAVMPVAIRRAWVETVYIVGAALTLFIALRFVDWFWDALPRYVFFLLLAGVAFIWLAVLRRMRARVARTERA